MPQYNFQCSECDHIAELTLSVADMKTTKPVCLECSGEMARVFIAANWRGQVSLKGEWPGKTMKENRYRKLRSQEMGRRQRERYGHTLPTLAPNVGGERVETWDDARKLASERGHDVSHYDAKVRRLSGKIK